MYITSEVNFIYLLPLHAKMKVYFKKVIFTMFKYLFIYLPNLTANKFFSSHTLYRILTHFVKMPTFERKHEIKYML